MTGPHRKVRLPRAQVTIPSYFDLRILEFYPARLRAP